MIADRSLTAQSTPTVTIGALTVGQIHCLPENDATWVRTGPGTALPSRLNARFVVADPAVDVTMRILVDGSGRPVVGSLTIDCKPGVNVSITLMRRLPVDAMMREALNRSAVQRPEPTPAEAPKYTRFRPVDEDRVKRVAEVYRLALAGGSIAPTEVVAATLGYSRATASRDVRRARKVGLIPPLAELRLCGSEAPRKEKSA